MSWPRYKTYPELFLCVGWWRRNRQPVVLFWRWGAALTNSESAYLEPPDGVPTLQSGDLEYWLVEYPPSPGRQLSVQTSDPSISLHSYGGGREEGLSHLFCYKGFRIGLLLDRPDDAVLPMPQRRAEQDLERGVFISTISQIGAPVMDVTRLWLRDPMGLPVLDARGQPRLDPEKTRSGAQFVTGLSWRDYNAGKRDRFQSKEQQEAMLALLPDLLVGLLGGLKQLAPDAPKRLSPAVRFSAPLMKRLKRGEFINGHT